MDLSLAGLSACEVSVVLERRDMRLFMPSRNPHSEALPGCLETLAGTSLAGPVGVYYGDVRSEDTSIIEHVNMLERSRSHFLYARMALHVLVLWPV